MDDEKIYKECEFDIHVYKTKGMENSKSRLCGNSKLAMMTGICSLLEGCLNSGLIESLDELDWLVETVKEVTGKRNKDKKDNIIYPNFNKEGK